MTSGHFLPQARIVPNRIGTFCFSDQDWTLDGLGNFSEFDDDGDVQTRETDAANQIQDISDSAGTVTPEYDAAGNMIVAPKTGDEDVPIHYVYDAWNRQVGVYADEDGELGALIAEYKYDGRNRRIEKTATADAPGGARQVEYYYNQNWQLLEERLFNAQSEPSGSHVYVWSQRYIDAPILRDTYDSSGVLDENARVYYTGDANYNVTATLDSAGAVIGRNVFDAYGKATVYDEDWLNGVAPAEDGPLYCGYWFDFETGNDLARNRYYSVTLATWFIPDPIESDPNLYRYCGNAPVSATDPSGMGIIEGLVADAIRTALEAYETHHHADTLTAVTSKAAKNAVLRNIKLDLASRNLPRAGTVRHKIGLSPTIENGVESDTPRIYAGMLGYDNAWADSKVAAVAEASKKKTFKITTPEHKDVLLTFVGTTDRAEITYRATIVDDKVTLITWSFVYYVSVRVKRSDNGQVISQGLLQFTTAGHWDCTAND